MTVLRGNNGDLFITQPGRYEFDAGEVRQVIQSNELAASGFLVTPLGDFVLYCPSSPTTRARLTVDRRALLGGMELVQDGTVIVVDQGDGAPTRFTYGRGGPPITFTLPAAATVRCMYSLKPLGGELAIRCSNCFSLYHKQAAWQSELNRTCPACGHCEQEPQQ